MGMLKKVAAVVGFSAVASVATAAPIDLGAAGDYTLLSAGSIWDGQGSMNLGSDAKVVGNVGARWTVGTAPGVEIDGNLHGGSIVAAPGLVVTGEIRTLSDAEWDVIFNDLNAASNAALSLASSGLTVSGVTDTTVFSSSSDFNVINIDGGIDLTDGQSLTISGDANDEFVINVSGDLFLCENQYSNCDASILLDGVDADNVLFNFYGDGVAKVNGDIDGDTDGIMSGNFISAGGFDWILGDGMIFDEMKVLAGNLPVANVQGVNGITTSVPEPSSIMLMLMSLFGLALARKKA